MNSVARWLGGLAAVFVLCPAGDGTLAAQQAGPPPASIVVRPAPFASWTGETHLTTPGSNAVVTPDASLMWWGLGRGATVGATAALTLTQAFCADDNGCVGRTIGAVLMGSLLGGALESGMDY